MRNKSAVNRHVYVTPAEEHNEGPRAFLSVYGFPADPNLLSAPFPTAATIADPIFWVACCAAVLSPSFLIRKSW